MVRPPVEKRPLAWALPGDAHQVLRSVLARDEVTWRRARGWVIDQCAQYIPYYKDTIPRAVDGARQRLQAVVDDSRGGRS
jgi:hypothetical protein